MNPRRLFMIISGLFVAVFALPLVTSTVAGLLYNSSQYGPARTFWQLSSLISSYESGELRFNIGNTHYMQEEFTSAATNYEEALVDVTDQKSCQIRYNWGRAEERQGDLLVESDRIEAIKKYSKALWVIEVTQCFESELSKEAFTRLEEQIRDKLDDALKEQENESKPNEGKPEEADQDSKEAEDIVKDSTQEIEQKLQFDDQKRYDEREQNDDGDSGTFPEFEW